MLVQFSSQSSHSLESAFFSKLQYIIICDSQVRDRVIVHFGLNVGSSAHDCGCMVDGGGAMVAI